SPRQVHDSTQRTNHRRLGRTIERRVVARPGGAAGRGRHANAQSAASAVLQSNIDRSSQLPIPMTRAIFAAALAMFVVPQQPTAPQQPPAPQQPTEIITTIAGDGGQPPRLAVPDLIALSADAETAAIAKIIGQVLWDDLNYEREFTFIPRDVYNTIPKATSFE